MDNIVRSALLGVAVADAVGVPVEFQSRKKLDANPVVDMRAYGTYNQPAGTWSDDSSLTFCLADSLQNGYSLVEIAENFVAWRDNAFWTARGRVFDIGNITNISIGLLKDLIAHKEYDVLVKLRNYGDEHSNGNGALMRILPLIFYIKGKPISEQFEIIWQVSALTHGHFRSAIACLIYLRIAEHLINRLPKEKAYKKMQDELVSFFEHNKQFENENNIFKKIVFNDIRNLQRYQISSGGYVMDSIEASIWCLLRNDNYTSTVLEAINLGRDTDTTAAIVGGLAGILYGTNDIKKDWIKHLARLQDILNLSDKLFEKYF